MEADYTSSNLFLCQALKKSTATLVEYLVFFSCILSLQFRFFSSHFKIIKQAPGHSHGNMIY